MRYRLPEGCSGVTLDGRTLVARNGVIEAEAAMANELAPHGIVPSEPEACGAEDRPKPKRPRS